MKYFLTLIAIFIISINFAKAKPDTVDNEFTSPVEYILEQETITYEDLESQEPKLLPSSRFYFIKEWRRKIEIFFARDEIKKIKLGLKHTDEKITEIKKLAEDKSDKVEPLKKAIDNYLSAWEQISLKFKELNNTDSDNANRLIGDIIDRAVKHERLVSELELRFKNTEEIRTKLEVILKNNQETILNISDKIGAERLSEKLEKTLNEIRGSEFKHVHSIETIDNLQEISEEDLQEKLDLIRARLSESLKNNLESFSERNKESTQDLVQDILQKLPGDMARRLVIVEEIRDSTESFLRNVLRDTGATLEKHLADKGSMQIHAQENIVIAERLMDKLERDTRYLPEIPPAVKRLSNEAAGGIAKAKDALENGNFGEAFGQARSAEVRIRNALKILNQQDQEEEEKEEIKNEKKDSKCFVSGCSSELCVSHPNVFSTCVYKPEFACYKDARCEVQSNGKCSWTKTPELVACVNKTNKKEILDEHPCPSIDIDFLKKECDAKNGEIITADDPVCGPIPECSINNKIKASIKVISPNGNEKFSIGNTMTIKWSIASEEDIPNNYYLTALLSDGPLNQWGEIFILNPIPKNSEYNWTIPEFVLSGDLGLPIETGDYTVELVLYDNDPCLKLAPCASPKGQAVARDKSDSSFHITKIISSSPDNPSDTISFNIDADDNGFYPSNNIKVAKNSKVKINFKVRSTNVYYGGLDFRSSKFKTEQILPGGSTSVEFTADEKLSIVSYWPSSNAAKAVLTVEIE